VCKLLNFFRLEIDKIINQTLQKINGCLPACRTYLVVLHAVLDVVNLLRSLFQRGAALGHERSCEFEV
jgi:hypothetical protein